MISTAYEFAKQVAETEGMSPKRQGCCLFKYLTGHRGVLCVPLPWTTCRGSFLPAVDAQDPEAVRARRAKANRVLTVLQTALNHAFQVGKVSSDVKTQAQPKFVEQTST